MISFKGQTLCFLLCQTFVICYISFNLLLLIQTIPGNFKLHGIKGTLDLLLMEHTCQILCQNHEIKTQLIVFLYKLYTLS